MKTIKFTECVDLVGSACTPFEGTKKYVSTGAIEVDHINEQDIEIVDYKERPSRANLQVQPGDILFAKMQNTVKTLMIDPSLADNVYSTGFCAIRAKKSILLDKCLYYLVTSKTFIKQKDQNCSGATQKAITNDALCNITIHIPSIDIQDSVVKQLDAITRIKTKFQLELSALDILIKARFIEMFGDLRRNPYHFEKKKLRDTCIVVTGNTPSRAIPEYYGDNLEWIKTDNIISEKLTPTRALEYLSKEGVSIGRTVDKGCILMACIAGSVASIGKVCITDRKVAFNQQINAIIPKEYDVLFLYVMLLLSKSYLVEEINMALKGILTKSKLEGKEFIVPPLEQQKLFAAFVIQVNKTKSSIQKSLEEMQLLFDSLMQTYFG